MSGLGDYDLASLTRASVGGQTMPVSILISGHLEGMARIKESGRAFLVKPVELSATIDRKLELAPEGHPAE